MKIWVRRASALITAALTLPAVMGGCARPAPETVTATSATPTGSPTPTNAPAPFAGAIRDRHPGFPAGTVSWRKDAPRLPTDRAVGPASLILGRVEQDETHLLMPDGAQWTLPDRSNPTLSPNGRWLAYHIGGAFVLRDLTRAEARSVPGFSGIRSGHAWSADGRWLIGESSDGLGGVPVLDLSTGTARSIPAGIDTEGGPLDSGVIALPRCRAPERLEVRLLDPRDPNRPRTLTFDAAPYLRTDEAAVQEPYDPEEEHGPECLLRTAERELGYLRVVVPTDRPGNWRDYSAVRAFLVVSLRTGKLVRRVDLDRFVRHDQVLGVLGGTILLRHVTDGRGDDGTNACELWQVDMRTGTVRTLTRFTAGMWISAPAPGDPG